MPAAAPAIHDWTGRTWYEVFVRSFADSDGDGIGDLRGLTARLDYLNDGDPATTDDLEITGIWLMPVMESPSYHGYDVVDYRAVERDYGTSADFRAFIEAAHQRGIAVIVDMVINHTSKEHPWFEDSAAGGGRADWYIWSDMDPGYLGPDGRVAWHRQGDRWYYGVFGPGMPDLNLRNPDVTAELTSIARHWLTEMGVDGFRLDAAKHLLENGRDQANTPDTLAWLTDYHAAITAAKPASTVVAEVWDSVAIAGRYVPGGADLAFDFGFGGGVVGALQSEFAASLRTPLRDLAERWPAGHAATFLSNHDQNRVLSQLSGDVASAHLAAFVLLTGPGTPFIYYGEEIGMQGRKPDERIRTPMQWTGLEPAAGFSSAAPWQPLGDGWESANVEAENEDPAALLNTYRKAIRLRAANPALREGTPILLKGGVDAVMGWLRVGGGQTLLTVVNVGVTPVSAYGFDLVAGPLCGPVTARVVAGVGGRVAGLASPPTVTLEGGFAGYQPIPVLPPRSGYVVELTPAP